jgi:hypothetical protein
MDNWVKIFKDCPYAKFVCLSCQGNEDSTHWSELNNLKVQVGRICATVDALSNKLDAGFDKIQHAALLVEKGVAQRVRSAEGSSSYGSVHVQDSVSECITGSCNDAEETLMAAKEKKYIYASKFSNTTLPSEVSKFLSKKLDVSADLLDCRLLVSPNKDVSRLNFVSFKIGVDLELFQKLLQPDIWPCGVMVREFTFRSKNFIRTVVE